MSSHDYNRLVDDRSSTSVVPSPAVLAAEYRAFLSTLRVGDLVDVSDPTLTHWIVGRISGIDGPMMQVAPTVPNDRFAEEWIRLSSGRITQPHSHPATNKHIRPGTQQQTQMQMNAANAAAALTSLAVSTTPTPIVVGGPSASQQQQHGHGTPAAVSNISGGPSASPPSAHVAAANGPQTPAPAAVVHPPVTPVAVAAQEKSQQPATPAAAAVATPQPAQPTHSEAELKKFRQELKVGDLIDFEHERHHRWYVGEISSVKSSYIPFSQPELHIMYTNYLGRNEVEYLQKDSLRIWPPMTKSATPVTPVAAPSSAAAPVAGKPARSLPPVQGKPGNVASSQQPGTPAAAGGGQPPVASPHASPEGVQVSELGVKDPSLVDGHGRSLNVGDNADCLDTESKWRLAEIKSTDATHVLVHYVHWSTKWDEWIARTDRRLQPPRTKTEGYTGPANKKPQDVDYSGGGGAASATVVNQVPVSHAHSSAGYQSSHPHSHVAAPKPQEPAKPPPRPSYTCLAACSWKRVLSTGLSHKEIQSLNEIFAQCCYVQDSYEDFLMGKSAATPTPVSNYSHYDIYGRSSWQPTPAPVFKHTLATVTELLVKLEEQIPLLQASLPDLCQFPLAQCASIAANIRGLISDAEETTRRQLLAQQEDAYMNKVHEQFKIIEIPSDGSCLFSAVGIGAQIRDAVREQQAAKAKTQDDAKEEDGQIKEDSVKPGVSLDDVHVRLGEDKEKDGSKDDPYIVLTLLKNAVDPKLQQVVASKCRADVISWLKVQMDSAAAETNSASPTSPSGTPSPAELWSTKVQSEVKHVVQQESAGKYSDATSKAVWEELKASAASAGVSPLALAETKQAVDAYLKVMGQDGIYGTSLEVEALSEMLQTPIHLFYRSESDEPAAANEGSSSANAPGQNASIQPEQTFGLHHPGPPICLAFFMGNKHFNALIDRTVIPSPPPKPQPPSYASMAGSSASSVASSANHASSVSPPERTNSASSMVTAMTDVDVGPGGAVEGSPGEAQSAVAPGGASVNTSMPSASPPPAASSQPPHSSSSASVATTAAPVREPSVGPSPMDVSTDIPASGVQTSRQSSLTRTNSAGRDEKPQLTVNSNAAATPSPAASGSLNQAHALPHGPAHPTTSAPSTPKTVVHQPAAPSAVSSTHAIMPIASQSSATIAAVPKTHSASSSPSLGGRAPPSYAQSQSHQQQQGQFAVHAAPTSRAHAAQVASSAASHPGHTTAAIPSAGTHAVPPSQVAQPRILQLNVHINLKKYQQPIYATQELSSLLTMNQLVGIPPRYIKFFLCFDGKDWDQVDPKMTPEELGLKDHAHVGVSIDLPKS